MWFRRPAVGTDSYVRRPRTAALLMAAVVTALLLQGGLLVLAHRAMVAAFADEVAEAAAADVSGHTSQLAGADPAAMSTLLALLRHDLAARATVIDQAGDRLAEPPDAEPAPQPPALLLKPCLLRGDDGTSWLFMPITTTGGAASLGMTLGDGHADPARAARRALPAVAIWSAASLALLGIVLLALHHLERRALRRVTQVERLATAGMLAASIAHEVKNPLGIVLSTTQLLAQREHLPHEDRRLLIEVGEEVRRADDQINAFLDLVRDVPLKRALHDLAGIIRSTLDLLAAQARAAKVDLRAVLPEDPVEVLVDPRRLRQALINLVLNGIQAAGVHGGRVTVTLARAPREQSEIITVADDGHGIPARLQRDILDPFCSTKVDGTGLGLSTARRVVERHGGQLTLQSAPGRGTVITVSLPTRDPGGSGIYQLRTSRRNPART